MVRLWTIRAGKRGEGVSEAICKGRVSFGHGKIGDLGCFTDRDAVLNHLQNREEYEYWSPRKRGTLATQINRFVNQVEEDDLVVMPSKETTSMAIGVVTGGYQFDTDSESEFRHFRAVDWKKSRCPATPSSRICSLPASIRA